MIAFHAICSDEGQIYIGVLDGFIVNEAWKVCKDQRLIRDKASAATRCNPANLNFN